MCTVVSYRTKDHYFGRNLDLEYTYRESVTIVPRSFPFAFRKADALERHLAMIGMAHVEDGVPLFYDAVNEKGLCAAGLNFPGLAVYRPEVAGKNNIAPFELIPWLLEQCSDVHEARLLLDRTNLINMDFSEKLPVTPMHWMIADRSGSIVLECAMDGMHVYDNPAGVLTNSPAFDMQLFNLNNYMHLSPKQPVNAFSDRINLEPYSFGMGAMGLPGDLSSMSRFVRAAFARLNACAGEAEGESVSQFFHILDFVSQPRGLNDVGGGRFEITQYASCMNADRGIYYYTTYENRRITGVDMHREDLDGNSLISRPLDKEPQIFVQN